MILAYHKYLGKFSKVLVIGKTPPPLWEKLPKNPVFFWIWFAEKNVVLMI